MCSYAVTNPTGGAANARGTGQPDPNASLLEEVLSFDNLASAWKRVRSNKGAPGIDDVTIDEFPDRTREHWKEILQSLLDGTYHPNPVKRVEIPKDSGGTRPLGIPTVLDRLIQQAIAQVLNPIFDPGFSESSFGFRPGRSAHGAVYKVRGYIRQGFRQAVDMDLAKFFDTVDHDVLMQRVSRKVKDKRVLALIGKYLRAGALVDGRLQESRKGVPQGGPLSPLLANILLDDLDKELERRGLRSARYADDFVILVRSPRAGERVMRSIRRFLEKTLKLTVNEQKSSVATTDRITFLGFAFTKGKVLWSEKSFAKFKDRVRELTGRSWFVSMEHRYKKLAEYLRGWVGYFGISEYYRPIPEIDQWLRRRIRMCYWKQWRLCRTKVKNLLRLGTSLKAAIAVGMSRKGPWRLSRTLATQTGMTNKWLAKQGLLSVKDLWVSIHYPAKAR